MKKFLLLSFTGFSLLTAGCNFQEYVHTTEPRSNIYIGQTAADVYENFGMPTKIERVAENKQILTYHKQEIEKDWSYKYFHECELKFYMQDDRLVDWQKRGDICAVKELSSPPENSYFDNVHDNDIYLSAQKDDGNFIPADAFNESYPKKEKSFFASLFSDDSFDEPEPFFENSEPAYETEKKNRVFIGDGVPTGKIYQNNDLNYLDIPDDAF